MGRDKALLKLGSRSLIELVVERVSLVCDEVLIVSCDLEPYSHVGVAVVQDVFPGVGVFGGLHAGLKAASNELALAVGCDMPFLKPQLLRAFAAWAEGFDVALLRCGEEEIEPLHGAYRRTCIPAMEDAIRTGKRRILSFFPHVRVRYVTPDEVASLDPDLDSFRNVNTPEDWGAARVKWSQA
jgi:molybdopterin-guanine dinucleotide biosynthesis protein A